MKLLEFFSVSNIDPDEDQNGSEQLGKDLAGFILDDDDIYKQKMLPILQKMKRGESEESIKDSMLELVDDACLKFYKKEDLKNDPNKLFTKSLRADVVKNLIDLNKNSLKKRKQK